MMSPWHNVLVPPPKYPQAQSACSVAHFLLFWLVNLPLLSRKGNERTDRAALPGSCSIPTWMFAWDRSSEEPVLLVGWKRLKSPFQSIVLPLEKQLQTEMS